MNIEINLYATLSQYLPDRSGTRSKTFSAADNISVRELLKQFNVPDKAVKLIFINGVHAEMDAVLKDGDRVGVFPAIGGG